MILEHGILATWEYRDFSLLKELFSKCAKERTVTVSETFASESVILNKLKPSLLFKGKNIKSHLRRVDLQFDSFKSFSSNKKRLLQKIRKLFLQHSQIS